MARTIEQRAQGISNLLDWSWCGNAMDGVRAIATGMTVEQQLEVCVRLPDGKSQIWARTCADVNRRLKEIASDWAYCLARNILTCTVALHRDEFQHLLDGA
jgi:hypothetical protein